MSDFYQTGAVATLHRLKTGDVDRLEEELCEFSNENPIALVLPCHVNELGTTNAFAYNGADQITNLITYVGGEQSRARTAIIALANEPQGRPHGRSGTT